MMFDPLYLHLHAIQIILVVAILGNTSHGQNATCSSSTFCENNQLLHEYDPLRHKPVYRVGVLAIRGFESAQMEFNKTFTDYLSLAVGSKFYSSSANNSIFSETSKSASPIRFELKPLNFKLLFTDVEDEQVDFIYVNPSAYACIEAEHGANSLVSQISLRNVKGERYELTKFGGVIMALANNTSIQKIRDLKGKSVAAASISGLGSGQMQFRRMIKEGMSYINDPSQVIFTSNQGKVVNGVLYGEIDAGFVRTDQMERTKDRATGELIDTSLFKVIEPEDGLQIDGDPFPFSSSTPLYPEWNVASLPWVPDEVAREVQQAMLNLENQAIIGSKLQQCYTTCAYSVLLSTCLETCETQIMETQQDMFPCDTSVELALVANDAKTNGRYVGFRSTLSYMELRNMQEDTSFINRDPKTGGFKCIRAEEIYDAIVCPQGFIKQNKEDVENGCQKAGLNCDSGYQCVCEPCVEAFDVDVTSMVRHSNSNANKPCGKMEICGHIEQREFANFTFVDNKKRDNVNFEVRYLKADKTDFLEVIPLDNYRYTFLIPSEQTYQRGICILEILADNVQISQSPLRVQISSRNCAAQLNDNLRVADIEGDCVCKSGSIPLFGCSAYSVFLPSIIVPIIIVAIICGFVYIEYKRKKHDGIWRVKPSDLKFDDPPVVIGRGTFGLVLLSSYRGTTVAVKRVIPPKSLSSNKDLRNSFLGTGDLVEVYNRSALFRNGGEKKPSSFMDEIDAEETEGDVESNEVQLPKYLSNNASASITSSVKNSKGSSINSFDYSKSGLFSAFAPGTKSTSLSVGASMNASGAANGSFLTRSLKRLRKGDEYTILKEEFIVEMRQLSKLRHPCITTVMGAVIDRGEEPMLVMEFMQLGSLYDLLHNDSMLIEGEVVLPILRDVAQGLRFLHSYDPPVIHGDLKAQNILVDSKLRSKVADFGLSQKKRVGATGTPLWMAPELLCRKSLNTVRSDSYSFGIMLYEIYSRKEPYYGEDPQIVLQQVCDPMINKRPSIPESCPPKVSTIYNECVNAEPDHRPTFEEVDVRLKRLDVDAVEPGLSMISMQVSKQTAAKKNERLLLEVFPQKIADALRDGRKIEPEHHECVTVFFSDIVGFTNISATLSPIKVSDMLDRLYLKFDALSREYDVFKIETIGDAYMAVTNLVKNQPTDHTKRIAQFARECVEAAAATAVDEENSSLGFVKIRVGLHSGPVVSNVVGSRNPKFTIIGDTVNSAARMESNSLPFHIQCSEPTAKILLRDHPDIPCSCRGSINVKGKGEMTTYWVYGEWKEGEQVRRKQARFKENDLNVITEEQMCRLSSSVKSTDTSSAAGPSSPKKHESLSSILTDMLSNVRSPPKEQREPIET